MNGKYPGSLMLLPGLGLLSDVHRQEVLKRPIVVGPSAQKGRGI